MDREKLWIRKIRRNPSCHEADLLIGKYYDEIYVFAYRQTFDKELSLDLTQEIFIAAIKSISLYDSNKAVFRTWLYKMAANKIIDYRRSRAGKAPIPIDLESVEIPDLGSFALQLERQELAEKIEDYVGSLSTEIQEIFRLRVFGEYGFSEIAEMTAKPEATVKSTFYRLVKQIRKEFYDEYTDADT